MAGATRGRRQIAGTVPRLSCITGETRQMQDMRLPCLRLVRYADQAAAILSAKEAQCRHPAASRALRSQAQSSSIAKNPKALLKRQRFPSPLRGAWCERGTASEDRGKLRWRASFSEYPMPALNRVTAICGAPCWICMVVRSTIRTDCSCGSAMHFPEQAFRFLHLTSPLRSCGKRHVAKSLYPILTTPGSTEQGMPFQPQCQMPSLSRGGLSSS